MSTTTISPNSSVEELLASAHELVHPGETLWRLDCKFKGGIKDSEVPAANRSLRFVLTYPEVVRRLYNISHTVQLMKKQNRLEPATERELVRLYPSLTETHGLSAIVGIEPDQSTL
jgi:hypothetical protein